MTNPILPLLNGVYAKLTSSTPLLNELGESWMVDLYPDDPTIEAKGVYDHVPEGTESPMVLLDNTSYDDEHLHGGRTLYHCDMRMYVYDGIPNNYNVSNLSRIVEHLLEMDDWHPEGFRIYDKHMTGELQRIDWNMFRVEMHLVVDMIDKPESDIVNPPPEEG